MMWRAGAPYAPNHYIKKALAFLGAAERELEGHAGALSVAQLRQPGGGLPGQALAGGLWQKTKKKKTKKNI